MVEESAAMMGDEQDELVAVPSESELTLLCLDYLRDLRRAPIESGVNTDYLTIACWALNRAMAISPNDAFFDHPPLTTNGLIPSVQEMEKEILYSEIPDETFDEADPYSWYQYEDQHPSNSHRFYNKQGLSSTPLSLGEIVAAGIQNLQGRSRLEAEKDFIHSSLFEQFIKAVQVKKFFEIPDEEQLAAYEERYVKVVSKFRRKIASVAQSFPNEAADAYIQRRMLLLEGGEDEAQQPSDLVYVADLPVPAMYAQKSQRLIAPGNAPVASRSLRSSESNTSHPADLEEAEKHKNVGNSHMQRKEYQEAVESYSKALQLSAGGPNSHVYFCNRAAALVSLKKFELAIQDSERSLALRPDYAKAHARLGLSHFLLGNYRQAMEAYTVSLKYEPDNKSAKNYIEKAAKRLAESGEKSKATSFSVISEWEKNKHNNEEQAEKFKVKGNTCMANHEYEHAYEHYSRAIVLNPEGPQSHVYYSNRAAALCYLEKYSEAEHDSLLAIALVPTYGKAHARLGLARFFQSDYVGAVDAYKIAIQYEPNNAASKSYLQKAEAKLRESTM